MKDRAYLFAEAVEPGPKPVDSDDLEEVAFGDVAPFVAAAEAVDDDKIGVAVLVQMCSEHRADKAAAAGHDNHNGTLTRPPNFRGSHRSGGSSSGLQRDQPAVPCRRSPARYRRRRRLRSCSRRP